MPSHDHRYASTPSHQRAVAERGAAHSALRATTHRSRHTTRRMGEQDGKPFVEVVETVEEVTRSQPPPPSSSPLHRYTAPRSRTLHKQERGDDGANDYPRLAYYGSNRASRPSLGSPEAAGEHNSARHMSALSRGQTPRNSQPASLSSRRRNNVVNGAQGSRRTTGLVESPVDITAFEDYATPTRHRRSDGLYVYRNGNGGSPTTSPQRRHHRNGAAATVSRSAHDPRASALPLGGASYGRNTNNAVAVVGTAASSKTAPFHFRVRIHECRNLFDDMRVAHRAAPTVYFALHTAEERGHTDVTEGGRVYDPVFNDEFIFTSTTPERDALVCTLVAVPTSSQRREKKVAECVLSLHKVLWQVERIVWVPLVRHPGTKQAYEQGEVRVSIFSEDCGYDEMAPEEEKAACSKAIHSVLLRYAPEELHRLDWLTNAYVDKGPEGWKQLEASYRARTVEPVPVEMTLLQVEGLMDDAGRPVGACDVHVIVDDGRTEQQSKVAAYRHRATFNEGFHLTLVNPEVDTMNVAVFSNDRKFGEAVVGLTNVKAGVPKEVSLMLVRAAETGDASNGGQIVLKLLTTKYSSPYLMTAAQEARLRNRVRNFLWCYLRDDLHRLDAIVGSIDNEEVYMREWASTIGPERTPKRLLVNVRGATAIGAGNNGMAPRCYARVCVGPETQRTELVVSRDGSVAFKTPLCVHVYDPASEAAELMLISDSDDGEKEISRVTFGLGNLPQGRRVLRTLHLVADALKRTAHLQGEVTVELIAEDFGKSGAEADVVMTKLYSASSSHVQRLEGITQLSSPEKLHRVPFMLDTAPPDEVERVVEDVAKRHATTVAVAPMTVKILGVRAFKPATDFYVKVYLNKEVILRTNDVKGGSEVTLSVVDNNERTLRLSNAAESLMTFEVSRHRALLKAAVLGEAEVALSTLIRGEKNVLWLPFFRSSDDSSSSAKRSSYSSDKPEKSIKVKGNRMPNSVSRSPRHAQYYGGGEPQGDAASVALRGGASPVGFLGVELQSMAFPNTTVTEYVIKDQSGTKSVPAQAVVTTDVTSLVAKMRPSDLSKVQPMIAQCSSLKDAHAELRARLSPVRIAGTVYIQVQSVELTSPEGQLQESQGGISVEASFGSDRGVSHKRVDFSSSAARSHPRYSQVRLDIPESVASRRSGRGREAGREDAGVPALELRLIGGRPPGTTAVVCGGGPSGAAAAAGSGLMLAYDAVDNISNTTSGSYYYVGGENNINSYLKSPKRHRHSLSIKQPDAERVGRPSKMLISQQQQHEQLQRYSGSLSPARNGVAAEESAGVSVPRRRLRANSAFNGSSFYHHSQQPRSHHHDVTETGPGKRYLGGVNDIRSYAGPPARSNSQHQNNGRYNDRTPLSVNNKNSSRTASPSPAAGLTTEVGLAAPYCGEIGLVRLSLRALLTTPLYKLGDTVRVPIIAPHMPVSSSHRARRSPRADQCCVVGNVTLRIALPAFEHIAESLRLGSRHMMSNVAPKFVHYYERRIGAYLRTNNAADLVSFHYKLYEHHVATRSWPMSLHDWMQTLIKRYGPETTDFGPEPPLPFDPVEWERARQRDKELCQRQEAAYTSLSRSDGQGSMENGGNSIQANPAPVRSSSPPSRSVPRRSKESSNAAAQPTYSF
ncbi:hypothetical protein ABL78_2457 [Leptomonas seymouri]|uniref:C2 domain-containing protein n=1 Tax=Leptomonas seymouri TaxID=5684 RepID=A0A0N1I7I2_LEPSE|nr:hypothetical protein ABL78_2457 [Leptomonas seymouri]|eukprot:KPI88444.1 hypothetical protein ABL78_2457 [Leptomonas seymouri]